MRYLSVCSGIEAATVAWAPLGWTAAGFAEVDPAASRVLAHHYGSNLPSEPLARNGVPNFGDFTTIDAAMLGPVDLLVGGTPCQDFSVAGLRAGIDGERGNLTLEFLRLADRIKPEWIVWENVPGVLSLEGGQTFEAILNGFNEIGYSIECDILDAQYFGLAQRRRRVFLVCYNVEIGRKKKSPSFATAGLAFLTDALLSVLAGHLAPSEVCVSGSAWPARLSPASLLKRMKLFGVLPASASALTTIETQSFENWLHDLDEALRPFQSGQGNSASASEPSNHQADMPAGKSPDGSAGPAAGRPFTSISTSWSAFWDVLSRMANASTTLMPTPKTTNQAISICAEIALSIVEFITNSTTLPPSCFDEASSGLTALRAVTNYARQANSDLFGRIDSVCDWGAFVRRAERAIGEAERHLGDRAHSGTLFPIPQGLRRDPPARGEAGEGVAPTLSAGSRGGGGLGPGTECDGLIARALLSGGHTNNPLDETLIAHSLRGEGFDASEDGTGRGTPLVPVCFDTTQITSATNRCQPKSGDPCHPLAATAHPPAIAFDCKAGGETGFSIGEVPNALRGAGHGGGHAAVAFQERGRADGRSLEIGGDLAFALTAPAGGGRSQERNICHDWAVRRLMPIECERLQGFPDNHTAISRAADGPRYKQLGNSMAVAVMAWVGRRIAAHDRTGFSLPSASGFSLPPAGGLG